MRTRLPPPSGPLLASPADEQRPPLSLAYMRTPTPAPHAPQAPVVSADNFGAMNALTPAQISHAKREKRLYMISFLVLVCTGGLFLLGRQAGTGLGVAGVWIYRGALIWSLITTWRLCRAIGVGIAWTLVATVLSPFLGIFLLVVLVRMYA